MVTHAVARRIRSRLDFERPARTQRHLAPGVVVLEMTGKVTMGRDLKRIDEEVGLLIGEKQTRVIFDLSGVHFVDSSAVGCIVRNFIRLTNSGGSLRLAGVKGMVQGVLKMTQVDKVIDIYPSSLDASQDSPPA
jgi:anti-sigma B factor antagonist